MFIEEIKETKNRKVGGMFSQKKLIDILGKPQNDGEIRKVRYSPIPKRRLRIDESNIEYGFKYISKEGLWISFRERGNT